MKSSSLFWVGLSLFLSISCTQALDRAGTIKAKVAKVQAYAEELAENDRDPSGLASGLKRVKIFLDSKQPDQAEKLLDKMLSGRKSALKRVKRPDPPGKEPTKEIFGRVAPVEIEGYSETAMEPLISADGQYLFFNDSNGPDVVSKIHFARRVSPMKFHYQGKLPGTISGAKDMAPAMDRSGNFYFTSLREYSRSLKTLFVGRFSGGEVKSVSPISGNISSTVPGWLNMDCDVSRGGDLFVYSRARFNPGGHVPVASDLYIADIAGGEIRKDRNSDNVLASVNTTDLEYAPCFGRDGLELYFTRALINPGKSGRSFDVRIMMATRPSLDKPFGTPVRIAHIDGLVEGPTLASDGKELFFHKKVGAGYRIFRAFDRTL